MSKKKDAKLAQADERLKIGENRVERPRSSKRTAQQQLEGGWVVETSLIVPSYEPQSRQRAINERHPSWSVWDAHSRASSKQHVIGR